MHTDALPPLGGAITTLDDAPEGPVGEHRFTAYPECVATGWGEAVHG